MTEQQKATSWAIPGTHSSPSIRLFFPSSPPLRLLIAMWLQRRVLQPEGERTVRQDDLTMQTLLQPSNSPMQIEINQKWFPFRCEAVYRRRKREMNILPRKRDLQQLLLMPAGQWSKGSFEVRLPLHTRRGSCKQRIQKGSVSAPAFQDKGV